MLVAIIFPNRQQSDTLQTNPIDLCLRKTTDHFYASRSLICFDSRHVKRGQYENSKEDEPKLNMALAQKSDLSLTGEAAAVQKNGRADRSNTESAPGAKLIDLEYLTPLQRQRLDTAVMILVDYLVSASSSS